MNPEKTLLKEIERRYALLAGEKTNAYCTDSPVAFMSPEESLSENRKHVKRIFSDVGVVGPRKLRVLDVGSSTGDFALALSHESLVFCVEPDRKLIEIAKLKKKYFGLEETFFLRGVCESLPYRSSVFDVVICKTVLEHVRDLDACVSEMRRVLGDCGLLYIEAPNYMWLYEGHYRLPFLPLMPKPLFRVYARLLGKDPSFINHINYLTPRTLKVIILREGMKARDLSMRKLHTILIERDLTHLPGRLGPLKPLLSFFSYIGLGKLCFLFMRAVGLHPNIILVASKRYSSLSSKNS